MSEWQHPDQRPPKPTKMWRVEVRVAKKNCTGPWIGVANAIRGLLTEYNTEAEAKGAVEVAKRHYKVAKGAWQVRLSPPTAVNAPAPVVGAVALADQIRKQVAERVAAEDAAAGGDVLTALRKHGKAAKPGGGSAA